MTNVPRPAAASPVLTKEAYTPWLTRALAWLIDVVPVAILQGIGYGVLLGDRETACLTNTSEYDIGEFCATGASTLGQASFIIALLLSIALSSGQDWIEHRQVDHEVQGRKRKD
jgi:hypothetical protein